MFHFNHEVNLHLLLDFLHLPHLLVLGDCDVLGPEALTGADQRHGPPQSDLTLDTEGPPVP